MTELSKCLDNSLTRPPNPQSAFMPWEAVTRTEKLTDEKYLIYSGKSSWTDSIYSFKKTLIILLIIHNFVRHFYNNFL